MKKCNQMFVIVMGLLMFGLFCAPVHSTPFDGTWFHDSSTGSMLKITFTDNSFSYVWESGNVNGQFTYERNRIELQATDGSKWSTTYRINKDVLTLNKGTGCWHESGDFYKSAVEEYQNIAPNSAPTVFEGAWIHSADNTRNSIITFTGNTFAYTWYNGGVKGRIIFDNRNVTLITDEGSKWTTPYSVNRDQTQLSLNNGKGAWWWYGRFNKLSLNEYQNIVPNSAPTAFEGTWKHRNPQSENTAITFSGNSFSYTSDNDSRKGRFTNTDKEITLFADNGAKWTAPYTLIDGYCLWLEEGTGCFWWYGAYFASPLTAPNPAPTAFEGTWKHPNPAALNAAIIFSGNSFSYTSDNDSRKGRFTNTDKGITLIADNGAKWTTTYTLIDGYCVWLEQGTGRRWWEGIFFASPLSAPNSAPTIFEGTWKHLTVNETWTFTGNTFTLTLRTGESRKGRFIFDNENITLIYDHSVLWKGTYTVNQTRLSFAGVTFNKQ